MARKRSWWGRFTVGSRPSLLLVGILGIFAFSIAYSAVTSSNQQLAAVGTTPANPKGALVTTCRAGTDYIIALRAKKGADGKKGLDKYGLPAMEVVVLEEPITNRSTHATLKRQPSSNDKSSWVFYEKGRDNLEPQAPCDVYVKKPAIKQRSDLPIGDADVTLAGFRGSPETPSNAQLDIAASPQGGEMSATPGQRLLNKLGCLVPSFFGGLNCPPESATDSANSTETNLPPLTDAERAELRAAQREADAKYGAYDSVEQCKANMSPKGTGDCYDKCEGSQLVHICDKGSGNPISQKLRDTFGRPEHGVFRYPSAQLEDVLCETFGVACKVAEKNWYDRCSFWRIFGMKETALRRGCPVTPN
jgi:hypothetical protein